MKTYSYRQVVNIDGSSGYNRAARMIEAMEECGFVTAMDRSGSRNVLVDGKGGMK